MHLSLNALNYSAAAFHLIQAAVVLAIIQSSVNSSNDSSLTYGLKNGIFALTKTVQVIVSQNKNNDEIMWVNPVNNNDKCSFLPKIDFLNKSDTLTNNNTLKSNKTALNTEETIFINAYPTADLLITVKNKDTYHVFDGIYYVISQTVRVGELNIRYIIFSFFLLSGLFQLTDGILGNYNESNPRLLRFIEYSFSASIMIISIAVQTGITDVYTICLIFALIFATNLLGLIAEILCCYAEVDYNITNKLNNVTSPIPFVWVWTIPHFLGWITCIIAYAPLLDSFLTAAGCSEKEPPGFVRVIVFLEFFLFSCFGFVQLYSLYYRTLCLLYPENNKNIQPYSTLITSNNFDNEPSRVYTTTIEKASVTITNQADYMYIMLSFIAKTLLAWLILSPTLMD